jgi:septal ring factor EnvC (AmiA/AmiB activator)
MVRTLIPMQAISSEEQADNRAAYHRLESEMFILQSNKERSVRIRDELAAEIKRLRNDMARLELSIRDKEAAKLRVDHEISATEGEIIHLKKQMNAL